MEAKLDLILNRLTIIDTSINDIARKVDDAIDGIWETDDINVINKVDDLISKQQGLETKINTNKTDIIENIEMSIKDNLAKLGLGFDKVLKYEDDMKQWREDKKDAIPAILLNEYPSAQQEILSELQEWESNHPNASAVDKETKLKEITVRYQEGLSADQLRDVDIILSATGHDGLPNFPVLPLEKLSMELTKEILTTTTDISSDIRSETGLIATEIRDLENTLLIELKEGKALSNREDVKDFIYSSDNILLEKISEVKNDVNQIKNNQILRSDVVEENELKGWIQGHTHT